MAFKTRRTRRDADLAAEPQKAAADPVIMRFLTLGGATVEVRYHGDAACDPYKWRCLGCNDYGDGLTEDLGRRRANTHAGGCRSMPRPGVVS